MKTENDRLTAAQVLFNRIMHTWINPTKEGKYRHGNKPYDGPIYWGIIIWSADKPYVYFNQEVTQYVMRAQVVSNDIVKAGQKICPEDVRGIDTAFLREEHRQKPYILVMQGAEKKYYVTFGHLSRMKFYREFQKNRESLKTEGFEITGEKQTVEIRFDFLKNRYVGSPRQKRQITLEQIQIRSKVEHKEVVKKVKRHLELPAYEIYNEAGIGDLLNEARCSYIDARYFSCIAGAATAADRICCYLPLRYSSETKVLNITIKMTLGQKIEYLKSVKLITNEDVVLLKEINSIRVKHLHPRRILTEKVLKRDAKRIMYLFHKFAEDTVSISREYAIVDGRFSPKLLQEKM